MHHTPSIAPDARLLRACSTLLLIAGALHVAGAHAASAGAARAYDAVAARQPQAQRSAARTPDASTGKLGTPSLTGAAEDGGVMGGTIPSAMPGWQPHWRDADDAYVYVPGQAWLQGDTRAERQR